MLEVDQSMPAIVTGEAGNFVMLVLPGACEDVICDSGVKHSCSACHDVHVEVTHKIRSFAVLRMTSSGREVCVVGHVRLGQPGGWKR